MDCKWGKGPPTDIGFFVIEWTNLGGYAVFHVVSRDGILFARDTEADRWQRETRLDKWSISRHLRIPSPAHALLNETLGCSLDEGPADRQQPVHDRRATDMEQHATGENRGET